MILQTGENLESVNGCPGKNTSADKLADLAQRLVEPGKCVLPLDENYSSFEKPFGKVADSVRTRACLQDYHGLLLTTPDLRNFISGVILSEDMIRRQSNNGLSWSEKLDRQGIVSGVTADRGTRPLANFPKEEITEGLDGLRQRLSEYRKQGARFTKWHAVFKVDDKLPTPTCLNANAQELARFAALSQEANFVPIVEPEVLMEGNHSICQCEEATNATLEAVFHALNDQRVSLSALLLKSNMVIEGKDCPEKSSPEKVAQATLCCFCRMIPAAVPGVILSPGAQDEITATKNVNALNQCRDVPWKLSLSFGPALQNSAIRAWRGNPENSEAARQALSHRGASVYHAQYGYNTEKMEDDSHDRVA